MDKSIFERRLRNFENLMAKNAEVETLTEEQHAALAALAHLRHELHTNWDVLFNDEAGGNKSLWKRYSEIDENMSSCGLEPLGLPDYTESFTTSMDYEIDSEGMDYHEWYEEYFSVFCDEMEGVNDTIENYLEKIDKEHGTKYAPTGMTRLY